MDKLRCSLVIVLALGTLYASAHPSDVQDPAGEEAPQVVSEVAREREALPDDASPRGVSMIAVIADPSRFHGREVYLSGFVAKGGDFVVVSPNKESIHYNISENMIYLDVSSFKEATQFKVRGPGKCCRLLGIVDASRRSPPGWSVNVHACTLVLKSFWVQAEPSR